MSDPKLRHEFVGMMFAVTIAEVGLQVAALVQAGNLVHFLPEYSHLVLATIVIAASWVGWTLSPAPGARQDVSSIFELEFLVLLLDVFLVIWYFILVRSVNFGPEMKTPRIAHPSIVAFRIFIMFCLYFVWDILTKVFIYRVQEKEKVGQETQGQWLKNYGVRMLPTLLCIILAWTIKVWVRDADRPHFMTADLALLSLVLVFRAGKDLVSAVFPSQWFPPKEIWKRTKWPLIRTLVCSLGVAVGVLWTVHSWPFPFSKEMVEIPSAPGSNIDLQK